MVSILQEFLVKIKGIFLERMAYKNFYMKKKLYKKNFALKNNFLYNC